MVFRLVSKTLSIPLICQLNLVVWHLRASAEPRRNNRIELEELVVIRKTVTTHLLLWIRQKRGIQIIWNTVRGSSSGSAAAVSAGHVPVAIGTQTNGSVIVASSVVFLASNLLRAWCPDLEYYKRFKRWIRLVFSLVMRMLR